MHHLHSLIGAFIVCATLYTCLQVYAYVDWEQKINAHSLLGLMALLLTLFVGISGLITTAMMQWYNGDKPWSERDKVYSVAKVHRYASYVMLILGNGVCSGGVATYFAKIGYSIYGIFGVCSSLIFIAFVTVHEYFMRRTNRKDFKIIEGEKLNNLLQAK